MLQVCHGNAGFSTPRSARASHAHQIGSSKKKDKAEIKPLLDAVVQAAMEDVLDDMSDCSEQSLTPRSGHGMQDYGTQ